MKNSNDNSRKMPSHNKRKIGTYMQIDIQHYSWHITLNPNALLHRSRQFWKLREVQINFHHHVTSTIDEANELIINLCKKGERHFIIVGGDGSTN